MQLDSPFLARWLRRLVWLLGAVALSWVLAWLLVPPLLKSQLQKIASEQLGRKVTLGAVDFKPWTLELTLGDLAIATQDGNRAQFGFKRLYVNAELESLLRLAPVVEALSLDAPRLRLTHLGAGKYDIDDILARLQRPAGDKAADPLRFALFNLALQGGEVDYEDRTVGKTHTLRELALGVPFLSNLKVSDYAIAVQPRLAFVLNGSHFDSQAQSTPFAESRKTDATLRLSDLDLAPYLPYLPASLPVRLHKGVLGADLKLDFAQLPTRRVVLSGDLRLQGVKVADAQGRDLLAFDVLKVALEEFRPLEQSVKLGLVELTAPQLELARDAAGRFNLEPGPGAGGERSATGTTSAASTARAASTASTAGAAGTASSAGSSAQDAGGAGWKAEVATLVVRDGVVNWSDASVAPQARVALQGVSLDITTLRWPMAQPATFQGAVGISDQSADPGRPKAAARPAPATFKFSGTATDRQARVKAALAELPLGIASPYLAQFLTPVLHGRLGTELELQWDAPDLKLALDSLTLSDVALLQRSGAPAAAAAALPTIRQIQLSQALVDLARRSVSIGKVSIDQPKLSVLRNQDKRWMYEDWLPAGGAVPPGKGSAAPASAAPPGARPIGAAPADARTIGAASAGSTRVGGAAEAPWSVLVKELALAGGEFSFTDAAGSRPVAFGLSGVRLQVKELRPEGSKPVDVQLSARLRSERGEPGQLDYKGRLAWQPLAAQGSIVVTQLPVHVFEPYFGGGLNIELLRADAGFKGDLRLADGPQGMAVRVQGDAVVEDFRANSLAASDGGLQIAEELLNWKSLSLRGIDVALAPGAATTVAVSETTLGDFFARVIVHENGRINLQNLVKAEPGGPAAGPQVGASAPVPSQAVAAQPPAAARPVAAAPVIAASAGAQSATVAAAPPGGNALQPVVNIGPVSLINGKVFFSDRFVKPNYSANLSELTGRLSAFSSVAPPGQQAPMADLELRGRAEGTASLEILGKLNPLAQPLALDIKGKVRDLELPPLSPYSVKYAGHGIERGKLSVDVAYLVLPDGQLTASNKLVLNQLTFGDKVDGAPASLPVKLAVALLADRNGVIDIDLPISGSLNDPQFRLGPIIFKVIVNLIVKAITAPFSLLASAFGGGGDELSTVAFEPGSALLGAQARAGLDKVAKALVDRPALKMTVVGTASLEAERDAYKRERLRALLVSEKRRSLLAGNASAQEAGAELAVSEAEAPVLLKEVYKRADITKPRNLAGVAQEIPLADMEALLLANIAAPQDAMQQLAVQRAVAVKDYLSARQLPVERLFLGAVKAEVSDPKWSPRAELSLAN